MADHPEMRKKRALTPDRDEELDNTPKYADQATMAARRVVRVRRSTPQETAAPSLSGVFSAVSGISPASVPTLTTRFGSDGDKNSNNSTGEKNISMPSFSFGEKSTGSTSFSFTTPSAEKTSAETPKFTFGVKNDNVTNTATTTTTTNPTATTTTTKDNNKDNNGTSSGGTSTTLFGGAFNFGGTVNSFLEAKEKMAKAGDAASETAPTSESPESNSTNDALANATPVIASTGEVLASIPAKLFVFKLESNSWVDCGAGDAKVKRHESENSKGDEKKQKYLYRLIVRDGYTLNAPLCSSFRLNKAEDTHVIFAMPSNDKITTYLLKYTGQQAATRGAEFTKTLKETLELAQANSS
ncbi:uncharacterized protein TM35_000342070 [Trypanosoma theileri]|uniref:RanBD1 domain-containing protein n=1 Tax=Trypanosoma theileri TaxID=67003 RepID=A0A1X0NLL4_9TRYP|nr:uncharacterized protein TM35_000342070 [Trypanosoma theileri]ORC85595.1 hypothetical protein TM35_000342070 [Trypanosoma theileri]